MINNYIQFISNVKGLQSLEKRTKVFEYLKKNAFPIMSLCFFKRCTPPYTMKKDGKISLKENVFSHTDTGTLAEWLLDSKET